MEVSGERATYPQLSWLREWHLPQFIGDSSDLDFNHMLIIYWRTAAGNYKTEV